MESRFYSSQANEEENVNEKSLRPKNFSEYIGQSKVVKNIELMVKSSHKRKEAMDHVLLSGPPGLGKTSLAMIISNELGTNLHTITGPALEKKGDLAAILTNLEKGDVLFIDEIHRMNISIEEILYSAMEDFRLDIIIGQGPSARTMEVAIEPFTLIGATTRSGLLSSPLRDRFTAHLHFEFYSPEDLATIIKNNALKFNIQVDEASLLKISTCSRGTPRIANRILKRVRDFAIVEDYECVDKTVVDNSLDLMDIDHLGLDRMDRKIIKVIYEYYGGGPVGIDALCATLGEDRTTIEDVYEPYLLKEGYLIRTPRGREISQKSKNHITS